MFKITETFQKNTPTLDVLITNYLKSVLDRFE